MIGFLTVGAALAAVPYAAPAPPTWTDWTLRAELAGGVDAWSGGGGAALEGSLAAWWSRPLGGARAYAGYGGLVEALPAHRFTSWDAHAVDVGVSTQGRARVGLAANARGGVANSPAWGALLAGPTAAVDAGDGAWMAAQVGALHRGGGGAMSGGYGAVLSGGWTSPRALRLRGRAQLDRYVSHQLPAFLSELDVAAAAPVRTATLTIGSAVTWTGPGGARVAGLPEPGSVLARGYIALDAPLGGPWIWHLEAGAERGARTLDYARFRAFTGFAVRFGALTRAAPHARPAGAVTFELRAPDATAVEVIGAFTTWQAMPMLPAGDGTWSVTLPLGPGEYEYAYVVDGEPVTPPESAIRRPDGYGGGNGVILVTPASSGR